MLTHCVLAIIIGDRRLYIPAQGGLVTCQAMVVHKLVLSSMSQHAKSQKHAGSCVTPTLVGNCR